MSDKIREMMEEIEEMKQKLREEIEEQEKHINYEIKNGYVIFEKEVLARQKENMENLWEWFSEIPLSQLLSSPVVYAMAIPAILLDIMLFIYQNVVSRVFKIDFVKRSDYIVFDRQYLGYLNVVEKFNCMFCSYFNGLMYYASAIASRTELYFCPIKHAKKIAYDHEYFDAYLTYGYGDEYQKKLKELREKLKKSA
ncbi:MAG: hypothetical protein P794_09555 [Epsilonproteobacteria bacterium (ex Lamellibrachia satsuma)]|nr:MAG: hypothetical protein P794_09555 [Epsilonproteobacteria bacterium (ex Lamellibrachia satsuma)]